MARFHVYELRPGKLFAVDLQANILDDLPSRLMVPLHPLAEMSWSISRLNPRFVINGEQYLMATQRMAAVPVSEIGPNVADLSARQDAIVAAVDFLMQGF